MFLIFGINNGSKKLDFSQSITCPCCGCSGRIEIIKTFTYFMLFFIPLFRWNKRYFVNMSCCRAECEIDPRLGYAIEKGQADHIDPDDLNFAHSQSGGASRPGGGYYGSYGGGFSGGAPSGPISARANMNASSQGPSFAGSYVDEDGLRRVKVKTCESCGYETAEDFAFCPKCGRRF